MNILVHSSVKLWLLESRGKATLAVELKRLQAAKTNFANYTADPANLFDMETLYIA